METTKVMVDGKEIELVIKLDEDYYEENISSYEDFDPNATMEMEINE